MRVITWNCRRATSRSDLWSYFRELSPDVAMLQEVCGIPAHIEETYSTLWDQPVTRHGKPQIFKTLLLVRGIFEKRLPLCTSIPWVQDELERFSGNLVAARIKPSCAPSVNILCAYSPAWPVDRKRIDGVDVTDVRLTQNPDVWLTDVLWAALREMRVEEDDPWVIGGDFNMCETFDAWRGGPRGNREHLDRMAALGLTDALRTHQGALTPTFRKPSGGPVTAQLDYLFVTTALGDRLVHCGVGDRDKVFSGLSDHLPVIADFRF